MATLSTHALNSVDGTHAGAEFALGTAFRLSAGGRWEIVFVL